VNEKKYKVTLGMRIIQHLGISLYSKLPAILTEIVANSYDADATEVSININVEKHSIEIFDDGLGMNLEDINNRFLNVGYDKRREREMTPKFRRSVMGRKGIGKLSLFAIAKNIAVYTSKEGEKNAFLLSDEKLSSNETEYYPDVLDSSVIDFEHGTKIILTDLKIKIENFKNNLRKNLSKRFSVIGRDEDFCVKIDNIPVTLEDRPFYKDVQFIWYLGEESLCDVNRKFNGKNVSKMIPLNNVVNKEKNYIVTGWVGTFLHSSNKKGGTFLHSSNYDKEEENIISVYANGRIIQEDILVVLKEHGIFAQYLVGEIDADFLDLGPVDISTSDRQRLIQDDDRYFDLKNFVKNEIIRPIGRSWGVLRTELNTKRLDIKRSEQNFVNNIEHRENPKTDLVKKLDSEIELGKTDLVKKLDSEIELRKTDLVKKLDSENNEEILNNSDISRSFNKSLTDLDKFEKESWIQVMRKRLEMVKVFCKILPDLKEKEIQECLYKHLWLLNPEWENSTNPRMEETIVKEFENIKNKLTEEEQRARVDIYFRNMEGHYVIIELKKYDRTVHINDLVKQIDKYRSGLKKCIKTNFPNESRKIEIICVLGKLPIPFDESDINEGKLRVIDAKCFTYNELISKTVNFYENEIEKFSNF